MQDFTELAIASLASGGITGGCAWQAIRVHIQYLAANQKKTDNKVEALAEQLHQHEVKQAGKTRLEILAENLQQRGEGNHG